MLRSLSISACVIVLALGRIMPVAAQTVEPATPTPTTLPGPASTAVPTPAATATSLSTSIPLATSTATLVATPTPTPTPVNTPSPTPQPTAIRPDLGSGASFAAFGHMSVANTGLTTVVGNVGVSPSWNVAGFPPGVITSGAMHVGDALAMSARTDLQSAYATASGQSCDFDLTGLDLGGRTVKAGVSCFSAAAALTGTVPLVLDGQGNPDAVFIFKIGSTLDTAAASRMVVANQADPCNVFWQVNGAAGMAAGSVFVGNVLAATSVTSGAGVTNPGGGLYGLTGAVTLDSNHLTACQLPSATPTPTATAAFTATTTPTPGSRTASVADFPLSSVTYSHSATEGSGTLTLTARDATGSAAGWHVTIQSSDFVYAGSNGGSDISALAFAVTSAGAPTMTAGQAVDATGGPKVPAANATGTLNQPRAVLQAAPGFGSGTYTQAIGVSLNIPGQARAGTYTGTLTVTIAANP
jgi:hypothetical protein